MAKKTLHCFILNPKETRVADIGRDLDSWYAALSENGPTVDMVEFATRRVGGRVFTFIVDEEGLFKNQPIVTAFDGNGNPMLVGSMIICWPSDHDLTEDDIAHLRSHVTKGVYGWQLNDVEYA